jgi:hypothetical protein
MRPVQGHPACTRILFQLSTRSHACCFSDSSVLDRLLFVQGGAVIPSFDEKCSSQVFESRVEQSVG